MWFGGGKLAPDLTLPQLQRRWTDPPPTAGSSLAGPDLTMPVPWPRAEHADPTTTAAEREQVWQQALTATALATAHLETVGLNDPGSAADVAWATGDFLAAAARVVEGRRGGLLSQAAASFDGAARDVRGKPVSPTQAGQGLRTAGRLLLGVQIVRRGEQRQLLAMLAQLAALADTVTRMRESQQRAGQARAARTTAEQLHQELRRRGALVPATALRPRSTARHTMASTERAGTLTR